jgi:hypothetical protein
MPFKLSPSKVVPTNEEQDHMETIVEHLFASNTREFKLEKAGTPFGESWSVRHLYEDILPEEDVDHSSHYFRDELRLPQGLEDIKFSKQLDELASDFNAANEETYGDAFFTLYGQDYISPLMPNRPFHKEICIIVARGKVTKCCFFTYL